MRAAGACRLEAGRRRYPFARRLWCHSAPVLCALFRWRAAVWERRGREELAFGGSLASNFRLSLATRRHRACHDRRPGSGSARVALGRPRACPAGFIFLVGASLPAALSLGRLLERAKAEKKLFDLLTRRACTTDAPNGRTNSDALDDARRAPHGLRRRRFNRARAQRAPAGVRSHRWPASVAAKMTAKAGRSSACCCVRLLGQAARALCTGGRAVIIFGCLCARQQSRRVRRVGWLAVVFVICLIMAVILCWLFSPLSRARLRLQAANASERL